MTGKTPLYSIPYLLGSDRMSLIADTSKAQAEAIEAALKPKGATPVASDLAALVTRLNAVEAKLQALAALASLTLPSAIRVATFSSATDANGRITVQHGGTSAPTVVLTQATTGSNETLSKITRFVVESRTTASVTLRAVRTDNSSWLTSNPVSGHMISIWS